MALLFRCAEARGAEVEIGIAATRTSLGRGWERLYVRMNGEFSMEEKSEWSGEGILPSWEFAGR